MKISLSEVESMTSFPREGVVIPSAARQSEADCGLEGVMAARGSYTVGRLIDLYMRDYRGRDASLHQRLAWWAIQFGDMAIQDIDQDVVAYLIPQIKARVPRVYAGIDADGNRIFKSKGRTVSPATVNRYVAALSALFSFAIDARLSAKGWVHPCRGISRQREDNERVRFLSEQEREALLTSAKTSSWDRLYLLLLMAIVTGARKGNLLGLTWADIDLVRGEATLHRTKNQDRQVLALTPVLVNELTRLKAGQSERNLIFASKRCPDQPLNPNHAFQTALKRAKIKDFRFHDLRHTCASYLARSGASTLQVAEVLGHRVLAMAKRYSHFNIEDKSHLVRTTLGHIS